MSLLSSGTGTKATTSEVLFCSSPQTEKKRSFLRTFLFRTRKDSLSVTVYATRSGCVLGNRNTEKSKKFWAGVSIAGYKWYSHLSVG